MQSDLREVKSVSERSQVAIIGAGIGGMAAAYDLAQAGRQVTIFESTDHTGGLASGFKEPHWDWTVEKYYHHWFASDKHMFRLIDELGFQDDVIFRRPYTVVYHEGKFYPFDSIFSALLFPGLGWGFNKFRFGLVGLYLRLSNNWRNLERTTVDSWMRKWAGDKVYEMMWEPLMVGKFGPYYKEVNMAWMWARLKARTTRLGTFKGGFQLFADKFAERLRQMGVEIQLNTAIDQISSDSDSSLVVKSVTAEHKVDQVLVATSPELLAQIVPSLDSAYTSTLLNLKSLGAVVVVMSLRQQLSREGYYWFNIPKEAGFPFLALVEHTNYLSPDYFGGDHILYCGDYVAPDHEYFRLSKEEVLELFLPHLAKFNTEFTSEWVRNTWLFRTKYAQPVPELNHSQNIPSIKTPIHGLYFASMSQVYPWDRGTNYAVEIGRRSARMMITAG